MRTAFLALAMSGCADVPGDGGLDSAASGVPAVVPLRWVRGHADDTWDRSRAGLWWSLSNLGAVPPVDEGGLEITAQDGDTVHFLLDLGAVGLPADGVAPLAEAAEPLVQSDEVAVHGGIDLGRFLMRTLYEPWHYYRIVAACPTEAGWRHRHLDTEPLVFGVTASRLTEGHRRLEFNAATGDIGDIALLAQEGEGDLTDGTFVAHESEVVDAMANGRQRFAAYDGDGRLIAAPDAAVSPAGQPGRCMWCHEATLMSFTTDNAPIAGGVSVDRAVAEIAAMQTALGGARDAAPTVVDFDDPVAHAWGEQLVEAFLAPSVDRLALEWEVDATELAQWLDGAGLEAQTGEEYPDWAPGYVRAEVDAWRDAGGLGGLADTGATYTSVPVLPSAREYGPDSADLGAAPSADAVRAQLAPCLP